MAVQQIGYPSVPRSITDPSVSKEYALDAYEPMSFLVFIKNITVSYQPETLQDYYLDYLKNWNISNGNKSNNNKQIIVDRYIEFIKDISLNYTTVEERKFLSKLDFSNPLDLDIAIPFFSRKLVEIAKYFNKKREETKFELTRSKIKGTNFSIKKELLNLTIGYLEEDYEKDLKYDYDKIKTNIEIEVDELYDYYPTYFNQTPITNYLFDAVPEGTYDNKDLDYGLDIFLRSNESLIEEVFAGVSSTVRTLKEVDELFNSKRELTKKYISSDFFFLSTGDTVRDFLSGKLFDADSPISNFLNREYPTTASTDRKNLKSKRDVGFFKPQKTSIILIDGITDSYKINFNNLEPNTIYYYPDPKIFGKNGGVLTFITNDSFLKTNGSSGEAQNQPKSTENDAQFYGYKSLREINDKKYLDGIFESGYIHDAKYDVYNNLFGLFKENSNFKKSLEVTGNIIIKNLILNGHLFYDDVFGEGYVFDYNIEDFATFEYIKRSGIDTYTNSFSAFENFYTIFGRYFEPYQELNVLGSDSRTYEILEGAFFTNGNIALQDPISSDLSAFPGAVEQYYYSLLVEGGISDADVPIRALLDPLFPSLTANFLENILPDNTTSSYVDGGRFGDSFIFEETSTQYYDDTVFNSSIINISSYNTNNFHNRMDLDGTIYVRNASDKTILPIVEALPYLSISLTGAALEELTSSVKHFEIVSDVMLIETETYLIIMKILFEDGEFINPKTTLFIIEHKDNPFNRVTNRFKVGNYIYFSILDVDTYPLSSNSFHINQTFYQINIPTLAAVTTEITNTSFGLISSDDIRYVKMDRPNMTYDSRHNIFNISYLLKDQNDFFSLHEMDVDFNELVSIEHNQYNVNFDGYSNIFVSGYASTLNVFMSSQPVSVTSEIIKV